MWVSNDAFAHYDVDQGFQHTKTADEEEEEGRSEMEILIRFPSLLLPLFSDKI